MLPDLGLMDSGFMSKVSESYKPTQMLESAQLMHELLVKPAEFRDALERYAASVVVSVTVRPPCSAALVSRKQLRLS